MKRSGIRGFIGNKGTISRIPLRCIQTTNFKLHLAGSITKPLPLPMMIGTKFWCNALRLLHPTYCTRS